MSAKSELNVGPGSLAAFGKSMMGFVGPGASPALQKPTLDLWAPAPRLLCKSNFGFVGPGASPGRPLIEPKISAAAAASAAARNLDLSGNKNTHSHCYCGW